MAKTSIMMKMGLDASKVKAGLKQAGTSIRDFTDKAASKIGTLKSKFSGLTGLIGGAFTGSLIGAAKVASNYAKEMTNLSQVAGAGFEEFQKLTLGAKSVGIESEKLADIFKDTRDKVGDFIETGGGPLADFFENIAPAIGVTADEFKNLSGPQALQLYFNSLRKANVDQERMTFYMEAVASDATALIPLLENGGHAWKEFADEAERAGLIMDKETSKNLQEAEQEIDKFQRKIIIMAGEFAETFSSWQNFLANITPNTFDDANLPRELKKQTEQFQKERGILLTNDKGSVGKHINEITDLWKTGFKTVTEADRKASKARAKTRKEIEAIEEKIAKERDQRYEKSLTSEELLTKAKKEQHAATVALLAPFQTQKEIAENTLKLEQATTEVMKAQEAVQKDLTKDEKEKAEKAKERQSVLDEIAQLQYDELKTNEKLETKKKEIETIETNLSTLKEGTKEHDEAVLKLLEAQKEVKELNVEMDEQSKELQDKILEDQENQNELLLEELENRKLAAELAGDQGLVNELDKQLEREQLIQDTLKLTNGDRAKATKMVDEMIERVAVQKDLELQVIEAQARGEEHIADALQRRIDKQDEALRLMNEFGLSIDRAKQLAEDLAAVRAGPDLNQSGIVTPREQKEFDRQQKVIAKEQEQRLRDEIRDERERGGNIRNVSEEKRKRLSNFEKAEIAKEQRLQKEANRRINRERDPEKRKALIEAENERRRAAEADKRLDLGDFDENGGVPKGPDGKPLGDGKEPKKPEDPAKVTNDKLDEQIGLLQDIKDSLKC